MSLSDALIHLGVDRALYDDLVAALRANPRYDDRFWGTGSHRRPIVHATISRRIGDIGISIEDRGSAYWVCVGHWREDGTTEVAGVYEYPWEDDKV